MVILSGEARIGDTLARETLRDPEPGISGYVCGERVRIGWGFWSKRDSRLICNICNFDKNVFVCSLKLSEGCHEPITDVSGRTFCFKLAL